MCQLEYLDLEWLTISCGLCIHLMFKYIVYGIDLHFNVCFSVRLWNRVPFPFYFELQHKLTACIHAKHHYAVLGPVKIAHNSNRYNVGYANKTCAFTQYITMRRSGKRVFQTGVGICAVIFYNCIVFRFPVVVILHTWVPAQVPLILSLYENLLGGT